MLKSTRQLLKRLSMKWDNSQLKTLKVPPDLHRQLKRTALDVDMDLTPLVTLLLEYGLIHLPEVQKLQDQLNEDRTKMER